MLRTIKNRNAVLAATPTGDDWETPGRIAFYSKLGESTARKYLRQLIESGEVVSRTYSVLVGTTWGRRGSIVRRTVFQKSNGGA